MANIKKSFNFVDGLQVDFDSFVVNNVGNVGVGTSSPSVYLFNVYGDSRVTGLTTTGALSVSGVSTFASDVKIGSAVTITSSTGIVSATSYYGDGSNLTGVFAIATQGWISVNGNTGLSTTLNVGIGTTQTNTEYDLIVGTGISFAGNSGNAVYTGIITSSKLDTTQIDTVNISVSGIATITDIDSGNLKSTGISTLGITTVTNLTAQQLSISGISTFSDNIFIGTGATVGFGGTAYFKGNAKAVFGADDDLEIYHDGNHSQIKDSGTGNLQLLTSNFRVLSPDGSETYLSADANDAVSLYYDNSKKFETTNEGVLVSGGTTTGDLSVSGISTFTGIVSFASTVTAPVLHAEGGSFDAGTDNQTDVAIVIDEEKSIYTKDGGHLRNLIQKKSDVIIIGQHDTTLIDGIDLRPGTTGGQVKLHSGGTAANVKLETTDTGVNVTGTGSFDSIGIKTSAPSTDLQIRKASGNATLEVISDTGKSSISIGNSVGAGTSSASINYGSVAGFGAYSTDQSFNIINRDTGNVNYFLSNSAASDSGFRWHKGSSNQLMTLSDDGNLGIGKTNPAHKLHVQGISTFTGAAHFDTSITSDSVNSGSFVKSGGSSSEFLMADGSVNPGNFTGNFSGNVNATTGISTFNDVRATTVGVGTTNPRCALDLSDAQDGDTGFVLFPSTSTTQRDSITTLIEGAIIYNNTNKRLELYNGTGWVGIATEA